MVQGPLMCHCPDNVPRPTLSSYYRDLCGLRLIGCMWLTVERIGRRSSNDAGVEALTPVDTFKPTSTSLSDQSLAVSSQSSRWRRLLQTMTGPHSVDTLEATLQVRKTSSSASKEDGLSRTERFELTDGHLIAPAFDYFTGWRLHALTLS